MRWESAALFVAGSSQPQGVGLPTTTTTISRRSLAGSAAVLKPALVALNAWTAHYDSPTMKSDLISIPADSIGLKKIVAPIGLIHADTNLVLLCCCCGARKRKSLIRN